jgi:hypothetical protein
MYSDDDFVKEAIDAGIEKAKLRVFKASAWHKALETLEAVEAAGNARKVKD